MFISYSRIQKIINNPIAGFWFLYQYIKAKRLRYIKIKKTLPDFKNIFLIDNDVFLKLIESGVNEEIKIFDTEIDMQNINWNYDYLNKINIPYKYYFDLREWIAKNSFKGFDIKNVWELSRGYYLKDIAIKFYQTNDKEYIELYKYIINSWIEQNTYLNSSNWTNPMEVSIRVLNWILSFQIIVKKDQNAFDQDFIDKFSLNLNQSFIFLINNIEQFPFKSNHYIVDNLGIFVLSILFNNQYFVKKSFNNLIKSLDTQFDCNGVDFENSSNYQLLKLEAIMIAIIIKKQNEKLREIPKKYNYLEQLNKIYEFCKYLFKNEKEIFNFGDNDETQIYDIKPLKNKIECLYSLISDDSFLTNESRVFNDSGYGFLKNTDFNILFLRSNQKNSSHFHNDLLSFQLNYKGSDFFIDPNTFNYNLNSEKRSYYVSTRRHNTCFVNYQEQSKINKNDPFFRNNQKKATVQKQNITDLRDEMTLKINYGGNSHTRSLILHKKNNKLTIFDTFNGNIKDIEWNFYLPKSVQIKNDLMLKNIIVLENDSKVLIMEIPEMLSFQVQNSYISSQYNQEALGTNIKIHYKNIDHLQNLSFQINIMENYLK
mgnify:CR=1 FL=1